MTVLGHESMATTSTFDDFIEGAASTSQGLYAAQARATFRPDGTGLVETAAADMGQGAWTALAQIAADGLGLPLDKVGFRSGSSDLPDARCSMPGWRAAPVTRRRRAVPCMPPVSMRFGS